jgi:hypothetical protein
MSTLLHDLDSQTECAVAYPPSFLTSSEAGAAVDLVDGDGPVFAVLLTGAVDSGTSVAVSFEEADTAAGGWSAVAGGVLPTTTATEAVACASFVRTKRYVRCQVELDGPSPQASVAVLVGQQRKVL